MNRWAIALLVSVALGACEPGKPDATTGTTSALPLPTVVLPREQFDGRRDVTKNIAAKMNRFEPNAAFVPTGETVTFVNADSNPHHLVSGRRGAPDGRFEKDLYGIGISLDYEFPRRGTYHYHCTIHPDMNGQLTLVKVVFR